MNTAVISFPDIETYIEVIAGYRNTNGTLLGLFDQRPPIISLARYDVSVIDSLANQTSNNIAYTDRQANLAKTIVFKYERQLAKHNISIAKIKEHPVFRMPVRTIDRSTLLWIENNHIKLRFPYQKELVEIVRDYVKVSQGQVHFDRNEKVWLADLTEYNLNWLHAFAEQNRFTIDQSAVELMNQLLTAEQSTYQIQLDVSGDRLYISNAADSLIEYVEQNLGGFATDNLLRLIDHAPELGYTVSQIIVETVVDAYGSAFYNLCSNREVKADLSRPYHEQVESVLQYARETNRFPIYVYEPDMSDRLAMTLIRYFKKDQVCNLNKNESVTDQTQLIIASKIPKELPEKIQLLISSGGMMYGGERQLCIQNTEKVVYFTSDVYNKNNEKGKKICKLN